ncbi:MAG: hypothetical protein ABSF84_04325 [Acidimicrobiales bacterium]|jgi:hypothetical protein
MPRASRRRRRPPGRGIGPSVLVAVAATITIVLVAGSLLAIHTQSQGYRDATTRGYAVLADRVGRASTATGARLSSLMAQAPTLTDGTFPSTARGVLEQGLDSAVADTASQATQAANIASPPPVGGLADRFTQVMDLRATATRQLRTTVDQLLGMEPLPVAGAPSTAVQSAPATLISAGQAASEMSAEGRDLEDADADFRALVASAAVRHLPFRLHASVWVPAPVDTAPLGSVVLGSTAAALASSPALVAFHHLVVTAVGLSPPAVPSGGAAIVGTSCSDPQSTVPGGTPTDVPPTSTLAALVSVTNCGNVRESDVTVSVTVALSDPPGTAPPPAGRRGGRVQAVVAIASGSSAAPTLAPLPVASGHQYTVTVSVSLPPGQVDPTGATQMFLVQVAG